MPGVDRGAALQPPGPPGAWDVLSLALKKAPKQTKFILIGLAAIAAATIALSFGYGLGVLIPAVLFVLASGLFSALLAGVALKGGGPLGPFFGWAIVVLFVVVMALFISSAFFGVPERGTILVGRI